MASLPPQRGPQSAAGGISEQSTSNSASLDSSQSGSIPHESDDEPVLVSSSAHTLSHTDQPAHSPPIQDHDLSSSDPAEPSNATSASNPSSAEQDTTQTTRPAPLTRQSTSGEPKKCWICFGDSTEDGPEASPWRTPCPCALTAHEACLLDWIADLEAPSANPSQSSRRRKNKIQCPQCKTEIRIARPWSPVVASVRAVERITGTLVLPGVAGVLLGGVFSACFVHGAISVILVLGPEDWAKLVGASPDGRPTKAGFRLTLGLPLIPVVLVLSRTRLADGLLPVLPLLFFAPHLGGRRQLNRIIGRTGGRALTYDAADFWPPDAAVAFASIPYIRAVYNAAYAKLFAAKQKDWLKAVQREPREGEQEHREDQDGLDAEGGDGDVEIELNAQIQILEEDDGHENPEAVQQAIDEAVQAAEEQQGNQAGNGAARPEQNAARPPPQQNRPQAARQNNNNGLILSASKIADTVLGALCFPAIAAIMGEALRYGLPTKWTVSSLSGRPGLLQSKWGRSIVGGCLFVVMKDALLLYSHWRLAQDHHKRRVLDYRGPPKRSRGRAS